MSYLLIALGSALGGVARHWGTVFVGARLDAAGLDAAFPWGTVLVNISGSFLIGVCAALLEPGRGRDFLMVGVLGGYTTFSAFSLQTLQLLRQDRLGLAGANVAVSVVACLIAVWLGYWIASSLQRSAG